MIFNKIADKTIKLSLAMLVLVSAAFFVVPQAQEVQAQSGNVINVCLNTSTGATILPAATAGTSGVCPSGSIIKPARQPGVCVVETSSSTSPTRQYDILPPVLDTNGKASVSSGGKCLSADNPPQEFGDYRALSTMQRYNSGGTNTNTPPGGNNTNTPPGGNTNGGGTIPTPPTGGCETGFHKVGPLCVPNSPFNNSEAITGEQTLGGLIARIIKILLYFAGIVAVIMIIIGGYQVMTAGGNAGQAGNGRKTLTNAIIGLVIIILSFIIVQAVIGFVT